VPIVLQIDDRSMRRFIRQMPGAGKRSIARSLNKAITQSRTRAARVVSDKRNVNVGLARGEMSLKKASYSRLEAAVVATGKPIPLMKVKGVKRQTRKGVSAKVTGKGKTHLFAGAFIAKLDSGHVGVFRRADLVMSGKLTHVSKKATPGTKRFNLPVIEVKLPSVSSTLAQGDTEKQLQAYARPVFQAELTRLLKVEMAKAGAK